MYPSHLPERILSLRITHWGLAGYFGRNKTIETVEHCFYWPSLKRDVARLVGQCRTCQLAKQRKQNMGLHTLLSVSNYPWQNVSVDFVLGLSKTAQKDNFILVVDHFSKMSHFLLCSRTFDASQITMIYFNEVVRL